MEQQLKRFNPPGVVVIFVKRKFIWDSFELSISGWMMRSREIGSLSLLIGISYINPTEEAIRLNVYSAMLFFQ